MAALLAIASCVQSGVSVLPSHNAPPAQSCYTVKQRPTTVKATITFYGWPDNSPPGNQIAHPIIHKHAGGDGTYCNPTTFATERSNNKRIPYGIKIYVPFLRQYFIREDLCAASGPPTGSGNNGCYKLWFDLWTAATPNRSRVTSSIASSSSRRTGKSRLFSGRARACRSSILPDLSQSAAAQRQL